MYDIVWSTKFKKELDKLVRKNPKNKAKILKQLGLLQIGLSYKSLRIHKLSGSSNYSLSVDMSIRMIFSIRGKRILCLRIGTHEEVY